LFCFLEEVPMVDTQVNITLDADKDDEILEDVEDYDTNAQSKEGKTRLRSTIGKTDDSGRKIKGRGFAPQKQQSEEDRYGGRYETSGEDDKAGPLRSVEGWIVFASGIHEEATEEDIRDRFSDFGEVKNYQLPLDRRTGFVKGYALIEYEHKEEAESAIKEANGTQFMDNIIHVDWAFSKGVVKSRTSGGRGVKKYTRH